MSTQNTVCKQNICEWKCGKRSLIPLIYDAGLLSILFTGRAALPRSVGVPPLTWFCAFHAGFECRISAGGRTNSVESCQSLESLVQSADSGSSQASLRTLPPSYRYAPEPCMRVAFLRNCSVQNCGNKRKTGRHLFDGTESHLLGEGVGLQWCLGLEESWTSVAWK